MSVSTQLKPGHLQILIFFALILEVLSSTFWIGVLDIDLCRWIHFASGGSIIALILYKPGTDQHANPIAKWVFYLFFTALVVWVSYRLHLLFTKSPLDYTHADMLPVIQVMAERFTRMEPVYDIIPEIWGGVMPVYLPALWLPFVPATLMDFDVRWTTVTLLLVAVLIMISIIRGNKKSLSVWLPIGLWFDYLLYNRNETLVLTEEGVVYGYYILLTLAIYFRSYTWLGVILACCLLSRYSILFFAGAIMLITFLYEERIRFKQLVISTGATLLILITIGKAWSQLYNFIQLPGKYLSNLEANPAKYQDIMKDALGFVPWMNQADFSWTYRLMLILLISAAFLTVYCYRKWKGPFYLLAGLKLTLLVFYHFILIPYPYLFYTSTWVSIAIYFIYCNHSGKWSIGTLNPQGSGNSTSVIIE